MNVAVYTLGCRLNQAESEAINAKFAQSGFNITKPEDADLVIVDTCTVTSKAEQKARRMIRFFSKSKVTVVTGCYAEISKNEIEKMGNNIFVFSLKEKASLLSLPLHLVSSFSKGESLKDSLSSFNSAEESPFSFDSSSFHYHSRAYLKVQDGCDKACSFCQTRFARGKNLSLSADEVVRRAKEIEEKGYHEIVLTGVNLSSYKTEEGGLGFLLEKMLENLGSGMRLRLSSIEGGNIDERFLDVLKDSRIEPYFHIPIQSASEKVLKRVNRFCDIGHVVYMISKMREAKDDPFIACDVIAGLPGEGEEEFRETVMFLERNDFSSFHVFPFSPRPGTALYGAKDRVSERERDERALVLRGLAERQREKYLKRQMGKEVEILAEKNGGGTTGNYLKAKIIMPEKRQAVAGLLYRGIVTSVSPVTVTVTRS